MLSWVGFKGLSLVGMLFSGVGLGCRVRAWVRVGLEDEETVGGWLVLVGLVWLGSGYGFRLGGDRVWVLVSVQV